MDRRRLNLWYEARPDPLTQPSAAATVIPSFAYRYLGGPVSEELLCEVNDGIGVVTINRPDARNALNKRLKIDLSVLFDELGRDRHVGGIVLCGAGEKAFSAGSDIKEMSLFEPLEAEDMLTVEHRCFRSVLACPKPVVVAVRGYALGAGCELAMCGDVVIASRDAIFGMPELRFGAVNGNETALLMYFGGLGLTRKLVLGCELLDAEEARRWGLVTAVAASEDVFDIALGHARRLAEFPGTAYARQKQLLLSWLDQPYSTAVEGSIASAAMAWGEPEIRQAMARALEKSPRASVAAARND